MLKKKEVRFLHMFFEKQQKKLIFYKKFPNYFCILITNFKKIFALFANELLSFILLGKTKRIFASCKKNSELIFANVLKVT